ncbi:SLC13 family permease [Mycetocola zhujimingii]|uniref:SLC13 family permease n=1 Tax=Mycetocola zhujimingii TaxID=2079792 RepID=UPI000D3BDC03|nr:SLC13 family permease [Mycetocola zhujimingii]AWB86170.1 di-/tricarboxylate transporter [Mycetocola zhujimingii]
MDQVTVIFVILIAVVIAFVTNRLPPVLVAAAVPLALWATGLLTLEDSLAGFGNELVIFIATLFIVGEALVATGVTAWISKQIIGRAGQRRSRLTILIGAMAAALAALISINGAVAALLPIAVVVSVRAGIVPSRMLMPLAFAASAGSLLTLTGTPVNIIVSDLAARSGGREFGYFEFALVGIPLVVLTLAVTAGLGGLLLPHREAERLAEESSDPEERAQAWRATYDVDVTARRHFGPREGVLEVLIAPRSSLIGRSVRAGMRTRDEDLVILALNRPGEGTGLEANGEALTLRAGDSVLVQGPWEALHRYVSSPDVIAVTSPRSLQRGVPLGRGARRALAVLAGMILLLATGVVPAVVAGVLAVGALILIRVLTPTQAFRSVAWEPVVLIACMIPLSSAFIATGAADVVADALLALVGQASPHLALLAICIVTVILGMFMSNVATVLVVAPVAVSVASVLGVSILPFMMALTVSGAAAFLTPISTPVNMMVMQPAGYRFGDYWRIGLPLTVIFVAVAVLYVPLVWPF